MALSFRPMAFGLSCMPLRRGEICHRKSPSVLKDSGVQLYLHLGIKLLRDRTLSCPHTRQQTHINWCNASSGATFTGYMHSLRSSDCLLVVEEKDSKTSALTFDASRSGDLLNTDIVPQPPSNLTVYTQQLPSLLLVASSQRISDKVCSSILITKYP